MDRETKIHISKTVNVTDLSGEKVMIDFETGKYYLVKGVGNDIWDMIQEPIAVGEIIQRLLQEYDVSEEECQKSVIEFLEKLQETGMIG